MNPTTGTTAEPAAPLQAGGVRAEPLIDRMGRSYEQLIAAGKRILPKLHPVTKLFMPKGGRKPGSKTKPKMETPATQTTAGSPADSGAAGSPPPATEAPPPPAPVAAEVQQQIDEVKRLLAEPPAGAAGLPAVKGAAVDEYTLAAAGTVSMISTAAILAMGAHVKPSDEQVAAMVEAYAASFRHYGYKPEPPPWLGPVIATAVWVGPHFADERSQTTLQSWKTKAVNAWLWIQGKLDGRAGAAAAGTAHRQ